MLVESVDVRRAATPRSPRHSTKGVEQEVYEKNILTSLLHEVHRRWIESDTDRTRHFFICGVGLIVPTLRDELRRAGYARRAVQYEKW